MPVVYNEIPEGESISAPGVSASFDAIKDEVNALDEASVDKNTLHNAHLPSPSLAAATTGRSGSDITISSALNAYPGWNVVSGWGSTGLEASFDNIQLSRAKTAGILVLANMSVKKIEAVYLANAAWHPAYLVVFAIQFRSGGTWTHLARTERYVDMDTGRDNSFVLPTPLTVAAVYGTELTGKDVAIRTFIKNEDNASGMQIDKVRLVVSLHSHIPTTGTDYSQVILRQGNISAVAIQAEAIS
tara:strand:- start:1061 stop:1792 length:732 start_codon:yes stop_codon:yes gene_type:complete